MDDNQLALYEISPKLALYEDINKIKSFINELDYSPHGRRHRALARAKIHTLQKELRKLDEHIIEW